MDGATLQDKISRGMGTAARAIGVVCDAYRPITGSNPLASRNRFLQLSAAFNAQDVRFAQAGLPAQAVWYGLFDTGYLATGDYLVERANGQTWFVGALQSLLPATCVLTNRVVSVTRPAAGAVAGVNAYGGGSASGPVIDGFPASILHGGTAHGAGAIPADARIGSAVGLLPAIANTVFARGDLLRDDAGHGFVVSGAEQNQFGWRLDLRQAAS